MLKCFSFTLVVGSIVWPLLIMIGPFPLFNHTLTFNTCLLRFYSCVCHSFVMLNISYYKDVETDAC